MLTQQQPMREIPLIDSFLSVPVLLDRTWQQTSKASSGIIPLQKHSHLNSQKNQESLSVK